MGKPIVITPHMGLETDTPIRMPGDVLRHDYLDKRDMAIAQLARLSGVSSTRLQNILAGHGLITPEVAMRIARVLGTSAFYWLALQARWSLDQERIIVERFGLPRRRKRRMASPATGGKST